MFEVKVVIGLLPPVWLSFCAEGAGNRRISKYSSQLLLRQIRALFSKSLAHFFIKRKNNRSGLDFKCRGQAAISKKVFQKKVSGKIWKLMFWYRWGFACSKKYFKRFHHVFRFLTFIYQHFGKLKKMCNVFLFFYMFLGRATKFWGTHFFMLLGDSFLPWKKNSENACLSKISNQNNMIWMENANFDQLWRDIIYEWNL